MAESICRTLRDGALEGEQPAALTIKDTAASPYGFHVFTHLLSQLSTSILAGKSQARGVVLVELLRRPSFYVDLLKSRGLDVSSPSHKWIQILDCYTDLFGWKDKLRGAGNILDTSSSAGCICKDVRDLDKLYCLILVLGKGLAGEGKVLYFVAMDWESDILRHTSMSKAAGLLSNLNSHDQISSICWLLHSDLHDVRVVLVLQYLFSIVARVKPHCPSTTGQRGDMESLFLLERIFEKESLMSDSSVEMDVFVLRVKNFILSSQASVLHLFHLKMK